MAIDALRVSGVAHYPVVACPMTILAGGRIVAHGVGIGPFDERRCVARGQSSKVPVRVGVRIVLHLMAIETGRCRGAALEISIVAVGRGAAILQCPVGIGAVSCQPIAWVWVCMARKAGDAGEPAHEVGSMALGGANPLPFLPDHCRVNLEPIWRMWIKRVAGGASGGDFRLIGRLFMALEAGLDTFTFNDAIAVGVRVGPVVGVREDNAGCRNPHVNLRRGGFRPLRATEEKKKQ